MTEKRIYTKPTIIRHTVGVMNKYGRPPATVPMNRLVGYEVKELAAKYGSPLFVLNVQELREKYRDMTRAFKTRYPKAHIAYSYKTNYMKAVCSILHQEGAWAEVVSGFEYDIAKNLNVDGTKIIFNGPYKTRDELIRAFTEGSMVNIDNYDEMQLIEDIAEEMDKVLEVGIRVNMDLNNPPWHKFGFNMEAGHAFEAVKRAQASGKLKVVGLHIHAGTYIDDVSIYSKAAQGLVDFYTYIKAQLGVNLKYWDMGGGYASHNTLNWAWAPAEQTCPTYDQYAETICPILMNGPFSANNAPKLFIEPGRALVDEPISLITSVAAQKRLPSGARGIVLDAGMNILSSVQWYSYNFQTGQDSGFMVEDTVIYGGLCMNIDVLRQSASVPPVRRGDLLVIPHVGAYNISQSWQFIYLRPAVIAIDGGEIHVIKKAETREYVQEFEDVPDKFK
ncbi:MAG: diaminopimelate decarboxylase [Candidatus Marinimicrobia bacterium]|nr:diaminopimelate decarboxylase [Candidatus Neomarinimicrobiota bacterium]